MASSEEKLAWLFQYKPTIDDTWIKSDGEGQRSEWWIRRWANETQIGDLVIFWEAGQHGGLRGWGSVESLPIPEQPKRWRVPVHAELWLDNVIPRREVLSGDVFEQDNLFIRVWTGSNFRLQPHEAQALLNLFGPSHANYFAPLGHHSTLSKTNDAEFLRRLLRKKLGTTEITWLADRLIETAALQGDEVGGAISTTRLLLAALALAEEENFSGEVNLDEVFFLRALREAAGPIENSLMDFRDDYYAENDKVEAAPQLSFTPNAMAILQDAIRQPIGQWPEGCLTVISLICSVVNFSEGLLQKRLPRAGLSLSSLRGALLQALTYVEFDPVIDWTLFIDAALDHSPQYYVAQIQNDDPWSGSSLDGLGVENTARAFAALSLSTSIAPPLAIGIFGEWGSGKSFFMRLVSENIESISQAAKKGPAGEKKRPFFHNVVQIRFNAWHYVDANLWASLVNVIFISLNNHIVKNSGKKASEDVFENLGRARKLTLHAIVNVAESEALLRNAELALKSIDTERKMLLKQISLPAAALAEATLDTVVAEIRGEGDDKYVEMREAARAVGLPGLLDDVAAVRSASNDLATTVGAARAFAMGLRRPLSDWRYAAVFSTLVIVVPVGLIFADHLIFAHFRTTEWISKATAWCSGFAGFLTTLAFGIQQLNSRASRAFDKVQKFKIKFDMLLEERERGHMLESALAEQRLADLEREFLTQKLAMQQALESLKDAQIQLDSSTGLHRMLEFVKSRASGTDYSKHLGLVATVRTDFEELVNLMNAASESGFSAEQVAADQFFRKEVASIIEKYRDSLSADLRKQLKQFTLPLEIEKIEGIDRIILYIDDLDRCKPEKVVEVLQAVHLLLSFKLFIVYVAVDVRWVEGALAREYPDMMDRNSHQGASPIDYLEKIFQIPYYIQPVGAKNAAFFVGQRLTAAFQSARLLKETDGGVALLAARPDEPKAAPDRTVSSPHTIQLTSNLSQAGERADNHPAPLSADAVPQVNSLASNLVLSVEEAALMRQLAYSAGSSPRRMIRFLNVYQIIKMSMSASSNDRLKTMGYEKLMAQVAMAIGAPDLMDAWTDFLRRYADTPQEHDLKSPELNLDRNKYPDQILRFNAAVKIMTADVNPGQRGALLEYSAMARKFSFFA